MRMIHDSAVMYEKLFSTSGLSLDRLKTFCEIAEARGISRAAKGKRHGQSQYSRQLKVLESYLGVQLFERRGKGIHITEAGKRLLPVCKEFFTSLELILDEFLRLPKKVSIGAGESILNWLILPRLKSLERILPNTQIELINLRSNAVNTALLQGELDLGIVRRNACSPQLGTRKLGSLAYCLFVPRSMRDNAKTSDPIELLKRLPLARLAGDGEFNEVLAKVAEQKRICLNTRLTCSSFPSIKEAVRRGHVAAVLPTIAQADLPKGDFEKIEVPLFNALNRQYALCFNKRFIAVRAYQEQALDHLAELLKIS